LDLVYNCPIQPSDKSDGIAAGCRQGTYVVEGEIWPTVCDELPRKGCLACLSWAGNENNTGIFQRLPDFRGDFPIVVM